MKWIRFALIVGVMILLAATCEQSGQRSLPRDVRWVKNSIEYGAICMQTYRAAWRAVKSQAKALREPWAVVLDIDETVLNNTPYQVELAVRGESYTPATWAAWVERRQATPVPGAAAFLDSVRSLGEFAHVVFITNRDAARDSATIANLKAYGLWRSDDMLLARRDRADTKEVRRREVLEGIGRCAGRGPRRIIALIGDQIGDLVDDSGADRDSLRQRLLSGPDLGRRYFVLPNPMYGSWERAE